MIANESALGAIPESSSTKAPRTKSVNMMVYLASLIRSISIGQSTEVQNQLRIANEATRAVVRSMGNKY